MSQAKVDNYKKNKANRQKMMKKEKFLHRLEMVGITLVCVVFVGWIGYSIYAKVERAQGTTQETVEFDASAVQDYVSPLTQD